MIDSTKLIQKAPEPMPLPKLQKYVEKSLFGYTHGFRV